MTTARELYHMIENIEGRAVARDLTNEEFEQISRLQDQIADLDHPGYEMKEIYEDRHMPNDTLTFYIFSKEDGTPVDWFRVGRRGNQYYVRGYWRDYKAAKAQAEQVLAKWL